MGKKTFAWSPIRRLMKEGGAELVARDAVDTLIDYLEKIVIHKTKLAMEISRNANRKKITKGDMERALKINGPLD
jgi:histone H3/H4